MPWTQCLDFIYPLTQFNVLDFCSYPWKIYAISINYACRWKCALALLNNHFLKFTHPCLAFQEIHAVGTWLIRLHFFSTFKIQSEGKSLILLLWKSFIWYKSFLLIKLKVHINRIKGWLGGFRKKLDDFTVLEIESSDHLRQRKIYFEEKPCDFALISPLRLCSQHTDGDGSGKNVHVLTSLHPRHKMHWKDFYSPPD